MTYDAIIIGGGAAGLFCALTAGRRGKRILVIEHNAEVGRKIVISGGGRCNFTNLNVRPENFVSRNPHFSKSALARYTPRDFISLVKNHRIEFYEKKLGQLFCRDSSRQIVEMLLEECRAARVEIKTNCSVSSVAKGDLFRTSTTHGEFASQNLAVACGGLSFPKVGASDLGYRLARQFGLGLIETRPSLVALITDGDNYRDLAGVSLDAVVSAGSQSFRENILFTHRGLSGPAILQISNYWNPGEPVAIDALPDGDAAALLGQGRSGPQSVAARLGSVLPKRFAEELARRSGMDRPIDRLSSKQVEAVAAKVHNWRVKFGETEGYGRAEVTLGGVSTDELSSQTMEAKRVPGLYFIGEVIDVTGWLGGYNFQWAWASGHAAGSAI